MAVGLHSRIGLLVITLDRITNEKLYSLEMFQLNISSSAADTNVYTSCVLILSGNSIYLSTILHY